MNADEGVWLMLLLQKDCHHFEVQRYRYVQDEWRVRNRPTLMRVVVPSVLVQVLLLIVALRISSGDRASIVGHR